MLVILVAILLIVVIGYYQATQGLFSAMITLILSVLCAGLALVSYEPVAAAALYEHQGAHADAICMTALFLLPLIVLRFVIDAVVKGDVPLGNWLDRLGGGVLGLLAGCVQVGMLLIVMQMLPFGEAVLGWQTHDAALRRAPAPIPFHPDELAVNVGRAASAGALSGSDPWPWHRRHNDLLLEAFCARNTAGKNGTVNAKPATLLKAENLPAPKGAWIQEAKRGASAVDPPSEGKLALIGASVDNSAADADDYLRLPGTHFRLVTSGGKEGPRSTYPIGYLIGADSAMAKFIPAPAADGQLQLANLIHTEKAHGTCRVQWVYRLAADESPDYLVFRRVSTRQVLPGK
jgi:uncharacterized membrane protein required for colicin V production